MKRGTMLSTAILIATNAHDGQYDRGGMPYILHPLRVMSFLKSTDEEIQVIAVLHDTVEDSDVSWLDLQEAAMSARVISAVRALTKIPGQSYDEYRDAIFANRDAMIVKLADLRHNTDIRRLKGITIKDRERMARYHEFAFDIQQRLQNA
jgi:GTP diphosphokinase / guanosine-3',5'-bis(diphosphate) 3'-diphosphatase